MRLKSELSSLKEDIENILNTYLLQKQQQYEHFSPFINNFVKDLSDFSLRGGKRIRAILIYQSYKLLGGKNLDAIKQLSIFIELIQSFLLIHDDIMDHALLRRGGTTVHKIYENYSHQNGLNDDKHFGNTMAILCGDLANQFALEVIADSDFPATDKQRLMKAVSKEISEVIFGQINDILLTYQKQFVEEDVLKVHRFKTAPYTFRLPLHSGAILAGADEQQLEILERYAMPCGIAFQIRDDILGVFGDDDHTGKESVSDISEGKKTILITEAYKQADDSQKRVLDDCLGNSHLTDEQIDRFRQVIKDTGSLAYSQEKGKEYVEIAKQALSQLENANKESLEFLMELADYMVSRQQ